MLGLEPHTTHVPIPPQSPHPYYPYKTPIVSTNGIKCEHLHKPDQVCYEPITPTKLPASPQCSRHESLTPARAGNAIELITPTKLPPYPQSRPARVSAPLPDWNTTDSITPSKLSAYPQSRRHESLHNIGQEYHHLLLPLQNYHRTRTHMILSLFLHAHRPKRALFAFGKILCSLASAVDTRVGRPSRRRARRAASRSRVNPGVGQGGPGYPVGLCRR